MAIILARRRPSQRCRCRGHQRLPVAGMESYGYPYASGEPADPKFPTLNIVGGGLLPIVLFRRTTVVL